MSKTRSYQRRTYHRLPKSEHNEKLGESYMDKTPPFEVLTDTEYVCPPIWPLNHAHHGADSAALLPGRMRNRTPHVCRSGVGGRLIWNWLSGDQLICWNPWGSILQEIPITKYWRFPSVCHPKYPILPSTWPTTTSAATHYTQQPP